MKTYWGNWCIAPLILNLDTRWRWVVTFTTRSLYPRGKNPQYPLDRLGGPQRRSGRGDIEKNSLHCPCCESNPGRPARSSVIVLTELSRISSALYSHRLRASPSNLLWFDHPSSTTAVWKVRGLTLLLRVGILWRCGDGLFLEVLPLARDALLTTFHLLLENVLQTVCLKLQEEPRMF
jgi:hypothetical protein